MKGDPHTNPIPLLHLALIEGTRSANDTCRTLSPHPIIVTLQHRPLADP
jgi:hypothetical protein